MLVLQRNSGVSARNVPFAEMDGKMERTGLPSAEQARLGEAFRKHCPFVFEWFCLRRKYSGLQKEKVLFCLCLYKRKPERPEYQYRILIRKECEA